MKDQDKKKNFEDKGEARKQSSQGNRRYNNRKPKDHSSSDSVANRTLGNGGHNDVSWYAKNPQVLADAASLAFSNPLGTPFKLEQSHLYTAGNPKVNIPGIMALRVALTYGAALNETSSLNVAMRNIYSFIRHANSGHTNYEAPDLMLYLMAMDSAHAFHAWMTRLYGTMRFYMQKNRYLAESLVRMQGGDFSDLITKLADFRYYINSFGVRLSAFNVPNNMSLFDRHRWLFSNIYLDSLSTKAQMYLFVPEYFNVYSQLTEATPVGELELFPLNSAREFTIADYPYEQVTPMDTTNTLQDIKDIGEQIISRIITSEDMNIMSGDILKAYGDGNLIRVPAIPEDYVVMPTYDLPVLTQIHNARSYGPFTATYTTRDGHTADWPRIVTQMETGNTTYLMSHDEVTNPNFVMGAIHDVLFDLPYETVTPDQVMVASRLTYIPYRENTIEGEGKPPVMLNYVRNIGSEIVTRFVICTRPGRNGDPDIGELPPYTVSFYSINKMNSVPNILQLLDALDKFDYHPLIEFWNGQGSYWTQRLGIIGDVTNYTSVSDYELEKMHLTAILSELDVPTVGSF